MTENRIFPRINAFWPIYLQTKDKLNQIGEVKNISLSGLQITLTDQTVDLDDFSYTLKIRNQALSPEELTIKGLKKWSMEEKDTIFLGLSLDKLTGKTRGALVKYLSRAEQLQVNVILIRHQ